MNSEITRYRVFNRCKYDIGVTLTSGMQVNIRPGMFQLMTDDDIMMIETSCRNKKFFSQNHSIQTIIPSLHLQVERSFLLQQRRKMDSAMRQESKLSHLSLIRHVSSSRHVIPSCLPRISQSSQSRPSLMVQRRILVFINMVLV